MADTSVWQGQGPILREWHGAPQEPRLPPRPDGPEAQRAVPMALSLAMQASDNLARAVEQLGGRLAPVLMLQPKGTTGRADVQPAPEPACELAARIDHLRELMHVVTDHVRDLHDRVQV